MSKKPANGDKTTRYKVVVYKKDLPNAPDELRYETMYYDEHSNKRDIVDKYHNEGYWVRSIDEEKRHGEYSQT